jgi:hypothetical protein
MRKAVISIAYFAAYLRARTEAHRHNLMDPHHYAVRAAELATRCRLN